MCERWLLSATLVDQVSPSHPAQVFRATDGRALVWGRPPRKIVAKYATGDGEEKASLLLVSGARTGRQRLPDVL